MCNINDFVIENGVLTKCLENNTNVVIPEGVTTIGDYAFDDCTNLTSITIPESVIVIFENAFYDCDSLSRIEISDHNPRFKSEDCCIFNKKGTQLYYMHLRQNDLTVSAPAVSTIKTNAISSDYLQKITIPEGVTKIEKYAIWGSDLELIILPKSLEKISKDSVSGEYVVIHQLDFVEKIENYIIYLGGCLGDIPSKRKFDAVIGFVYAVSHGIKEIEQYRDIYAEYIKENKKTYIKKCNDNIYMLKFMLSEKIINEKEANKLLNLYSKEENTEITAMLVDYINQIKKTECFDEFDFDKQDKILEKKIARQKELANREGIEGVIFVATGDMENFGSYDEYIGAHNWDDLKKFIESRGGFLRSTVSGKTDYLICNDVSQKTVKLQDAQEYGTTIITEKEFLKMANEF